jgi:hypothetical protein
MDELVLLRLELLRLCGGHVHAAAFAEAYIFGPDPDMIDSDPDPKVKDEIPEEIEPEGDAAEPVADDNQIISFKKPMTGRK